MSDLNKKEVKDMVQESLAENTDGLTKKQKKLVADELYKKMTERVKERAADVGGEFKKQTSAAIIGAFGFLLALSWRELINEYIKQILGEHNLGIAISTLIITFISVLGIMVVSKWAKSGEKK